jgi:hypothetical protein
MTTMAAELFPKKVSSETEPPGNVKNRGRTPSRYEDAAEASNE